MFGKPNDPFVPKIRMLFSPGHMVKKVFSCAARS